MKLHYWEGTKLGDRYMRNFGDELNPLIWNSLLGEFLDDDGSSVLIGIGSLLNNSLENKISKYANKLIFGSGVGYGTRPLKLDKTYKVFCVRGPLSAKALGISKDYAVTDSALLIRNLITDINRNKLHKIGYAPHWTNHTKRLANLCNDMGIHYIDPTKENVLDVIDEILSCETVFAEAMHAAIVADALRVPWVPVRSTQQVIEFKWQDWCSTINIEYNPHTVIPLGEGVGIFASLKHGIKEKFVANQISKILKTHTPQLSKEQQSNMLHHRLNEKLTLLKNEITIIRDSKL